MLGFLFRHIGTKINIEYLAFPLSTASQTFSTISPHS